MEKRELYQKASLVIDRLIHLQQPDERMTNENKKQGRTGGIISRDFGIEEWDWPQGVGLKKILKEDFLLKILIPRLLF